MQEAHTQIHIQLIHAEDHAHESHHFYYTIIGKMIG